jgi:hypothetical protein
MLEDFRLAHFSLSRFTPIRGERIFRLSLTKTVYRGDTEEHCAEENFT